MAVRGSTIGKNKYSKLTLGVYNYNASLAPFVSIFFFFFSLPSLSLQIWGSQYSLGWFNYG